MVGDWVDPFSMVTLSERTEKLGERELLELKKAFGARAAKKLGMNVQIGNPREVREENERDFCV